MTRPIAGDPPRFRRSTSPSSSTRLFSDDPTSDCELISHESPPLDANIDRSRFQQAKECFSELKSKQQLAILCALTLVAIALVLVTAAASHHAYVREDAHTGCRKIPPVVMQAQNRSTPSLDPHARAFADPAAAMFDQPLRVDDVRMIASAAGVYRHEALRVQHGTTDTILLTSSNSGMKDFLENWMCHAQRLNYKFLVHSLDHKLHNELTARGIPSLMTHEASLEYVKWGQRSYHDLVKAKLGIVMLALRSGYDVLFSDIDIGFFNDPFPLFRRDCDFEFQVQRFDPESDGLADGGINTGFYYAKSNSRALTLLSAVMFDEADADDQTIFNKINQKRSMRVLFPGDAKQGEGDLRLLDPLRVVVGNALQVDRHNYLSTITRSNLSLTDIGVVHANFVVGREAKLEMLHETGTWLYRQGDRNECEPFSVDAAAKRAEQFLSREFPSKKHPK